MKKLLYLAGHFNWIEKHLSGCVMGIGSNGKLWTLQQPNELLLDSYRGTNQLTVFLYLSLFMPFL